MMRIYAALAAAAVAGLIGGSALYVYLRQSNDTFADCRAGAVGGGDIGGAFTLVDSTGKKSGRGCYICPSLSCLEKAFCGSLLEKKLEVKIGSEAKEKLKTELMTGIVHE